MASLRKHRSIAPITRRALPTGNGCRHCAISVLAILAFFGPSHAVDLTPMIGYDYITGSNAYYAHEGYAEIEARHTQEWKTYYLYSALSDSDYSLAHTLSFHARRYLTSNFNLRGGMNYTIGKIKDASGNSSLVVLDLKAMKYFGSQWDAALRYGISFGSLPTPVLQTLTPFDHRIAQQPAASLRDEELKYTAHTISAGVDYELEGLFKDLTVSGLFGITAYSTDSTTYVQGIEATYVLPHEISIGSSFLLSQSSFDTSAGYLRLGISKEF